MADSLAYAFAPIFKSAPQDDGSIMVYGRATDSELDNDFQRCDSEWLSRAVPEWYRSAGNIREQHDPKRAVGKATEYEATEDGAHMITAKIVDPVAVAKTKAGIFTGFSIGVKNPRIIKSAMAQNGLVADGTICEISLVDRPANAGCTLTLCKSATPDWNGDAADLDEERGLVRCEELVEKFTPADMAKIVNKNVAPTATTATTTASWPYIITTPGFTFTAGSNTNDLTIESQLDKGAMAPLKPGGPPRYPINSVADLKDAIQAIGRGRDSDKAEIKTHIKSEAKRLGRSDLIPDTWKAVEADITKDDGATHDSAELRDILQGLINCMKAELDELANGEQELGDIRQLLETVSMFCCWWQDEAWAGETTSPYESQEASAMTLAANPDQTKAVETDAAPDTAASEADVTKTAQPNETKAAESTTEAAQAAPQTPEPQSSGNLAELVKSAIADALKPVTEAAEEREKNEKALTAELATVKADLAKALALPEPGGPVITRTADQAAAARKSDALRLTAEADELLRKADMSASYDQYMAQGYRERAEMLRKQAAI